MRQDYTFIQVLTNTVTNSMGSPDKATLNPPSQGTVQEPPEKTDTPQNEYKKQYKSVASRLLASPRENKRVGCCAQENT